MNNQEANVILMARTGSSSRAVERLIGQYGSIEQAASNLKKTSEEQQICDDAIAFGQKEGIQFLNWQDIFYPYNLQRQHDKPLFLAQQGELFPRDHKAVAIVGTRNPSPEAAKAAYEIASELAAAGCTIVSGLARGIDTAAHWGALQAGGRTIAVLGSGFAHIYPKENSTLAQTIVKQGALLSEYLPFTGPKRHHFPQRNRIISGMSLAIVLIEAPQASGAMIAMEKGAKQGVSLLALAPKIYNSKNQGNQYLIKQRKAVSVTHAHEILTVIEARTQSPEQLTFSWSNLGHHRIGAHLS